MKKQPNNQMLIIQPNKQQCQLYQQIDQFVTALDRLPEAREVRANKPRSVPQEVLPMVF